ncbi:uncharacterized protein LOC129872465 [Solanum dulcamara]|uniref:uncharacterized protein LOC129872465 n=1 Tax=Solanum dulcamara TaxID=45834 RepID=UPI0024863109|nr:uncharacterized protein LOC129872465 [Solanum dulcamara]
MAPFEALYGRKYRSPIGWFDSAEMDSLEIEFLRDAMEQVHIIQGRLLTILGRVGRVAYRLALPPSLSVVHPMFHVSMLRKYVPYRSHMISLESVELGLDLTFEEEPIAILDRQVRKLRNKDIASVKVHLIHLSVREATWESEDDMRADIPSFSRFQILVRVFRVIADLSSGVHIFRFVEWWESVLAYRSAGSPMMGWEQFTEVFFERVLLIMSGLLRVSDMLEMMGLRGSVGRISSPIIPPEAGSTWVQAPRVIRVDQCIRRFRLLIVQVNPGLVKLVMVLLRVYEDMLILLFFLQRVPVLEAALFMMSLGIRQRIFLDVLLLVSSSGHTLFVLCQL